MNRDTFMLHRGGGIGHSIRVAPPSANYVAPGLFRRAGYRPKDVQAQGDDVEEVEDFDD